MPGTAPEPLRFDEVWTGQLIREANNPKRYRVVAIMPNKIVVRALGGSNRRSIDRTGLELSWFPAGAVISEDREGK